MSITTLPKVSIPKSVEEEDIKLPVAICRQLAVKVIDVAPGFTGKRGDCDIANTVLPVFNPENEVIETP